VWGWISSCGLSTRAPRTLRSAAPIATRSISLAAEPHVSQPGGGDTAAQSLCSQGIPFRRNLDMPAGRDWVLDTGHMDTWAISCEPHIQLSGMMSLLTIEACAEPPRQRYRAVRSPPASHRSALI
jgi:hypothetical protein